MRFSLPIEYKDTDHEVVFEKWKPALLRISPEAIEIVDADTVIFIDNFSRIAQAQLSRLPSGEPARYILTSEAGNYLIAIRPRRRYFRLLKQLNELGDIAHALNTNSGRTLADPKELVSLRWLTYILGLTITLVLILAFINIV